MTAAGVAWVDGSLVSRTEARVSIDDFGYRYGLACFETMLARRGRVFRLEEHLDRLEASLMLFRSALPSRSMLNAAIAATLEANALEDASVRLTVTPGRGGRPALPAAGPPTVTVTVDPAPPPVAERRLWVSDVRLDADRPWRGAKVGQFAPHLLARAEAEDRGADEALLMNHQSHLVEASTANLFLVRQGALQTPSLEDGPLPGVTRAAVIEAAEACEIACIETSLTLADLAAADAVFLTSSVAGLVTVQSVRWIDTSGEEQEWIGLTGARESSPGALQQLRGTYARWVDAGTL